MPERIQKEAGARSSCDDSADDAGFHLCSFGRNHPRSDIAAIVMKQ